MKSILTRPALTAALAAALLSSCAAPKGKKEFAALDSNRDGEVTAAEFSSHITEKSFRLLDANADGRVSPAEWNTRETSRASVPLFRTLDTNRDGSLELAEFRSSARKKAHLEKTFHSLDRDGDGGLTWGEVTR